MDQATSTYLSIVNDAIEEAGDDLASFSVDGSDFTTNTDAMMRRFKKWVVRAWRDIQQESLDWEWMSEQAVVNIVPGIMFYCVYPITTMDVEYDATIYDFDNSVVQESVPVTRIQDLTGVYTETSNFGYVNLQSSNTAPVSFGLKAGGNHFFAPANITITLGSRTNSVVYSDGIPPLGTAVESISYSTEDSFGNTLTGSVDIVGETTLSAVDFSSFAILCTGGIGEWWGQVLSAVMSNLDYQFTSVTIHMVDGTTASLEIYSPSYDAQNSAYLFTTPPPVIDQTTDTKICTVIGIDVVFSGIAVGNLIDEVVIADTGTVDGTYDNAGFVTMIDDDGTGRRFSFEVTDPELLSAIQVANGSTSSNATITFKTGATTKATATKTQVNTTNKFFYIFYPAKTGDPGKLYVHSWKSFDFSEETGEDDFVENIREINQKTWRLIYHEDPSPAAEQPLQFIPWESFQNRYDWTSSPPSTPRLVTEDNTGRWRFYPSPDRPYTVLFDYVREPQILSAFDDVPKGLPEEYLDLIMWRAIAYYGEYDEQPSVAGRGWKNYKNLLMKFEMQTREKFHFKSGYSFGGRTY